MTLDTAERPPLADESTPLERAGRDLQARLAVLAADAGLPAPGVAVLGANDVLRPEPPEQARHRAAATVHLTAESVLVGPWGAPGEPGEAGTACGGCLAIRWQRLRTRTEREALETGRSLTAAGTWPVLPDYAADAVGALHAWAAGQPAAPAGGHARVTRYDLESGLVHTVPLLPEPLCGNHGPQQRDS
ncbi:MAG: TOMM precursor leader peptide-binding protein, partial [Actinomycetia bacterium]|nr:TOMM precursor leader peptide-binding protein [Actinomycetes bacterium]